MRGGLQLDDFSLQLHCCSWSLDVVADVEWPQDGDCLGRGLEVGGGEGAGGGAQMPTVPRAQDAKTILVCGLRR